MWEIFMCGFSWGHDINYLNVWHACYLCHDYYINHHKYNIYQSPLLKGYAYFGSPLILSHAHLWGWVLVPSLTVGGAMDSSYS